MSFDTEHYSVFVIAKSDDAAFAFPNKCEITYAHTYFTYARINFIYVARLIRKYYATVFTTE